MATSIRQQTYTAAAATALSTELNSLANGSYCTASAAIDNSTNLDLFDQLELNVTYGVAPSTGGTVDVFLLPSLDGTNYPDGGGATAPAPENQVGSFTLRAVTTAQRLSLRDIPIPPGLFKYVLKNSAGQAMAASGNTLKHRSYSMQSG